MIKFIFSKHMLIKKKTVNSGLERFLMLKMSYHLNSLSPHSFLHLSLSLPNPFLATEPASSHFKGWEVKSRSGSYTPELTTPPQVLTSLQYCRTGLYFCNAHIWAGLVAQTWNPLHSEGKLGPTWTAQWESLSKNSKPITPSQSKDTSDWSRQWHALRPESSTPSNS